MKETLTVIAKIEKCIYVYIKNIGIKIPIKIQWIFNLVVFFWQLIGPQFIWAIQPTLGEIWTPEVEQAWSDLFKYITHYMKAAMVF